MSSITPFGAHPTYVSVEESPDVVQQVIPLIHIVIKLRYQKKQCVIIIISRINRIVVVRNHATIIYFHSPIQE